MAYKTNCQWSGDPRNQMVSCGAYPYHLCPSTVVGAGPLVKPLENFPVLCNSHHQLLGVSTQPSHGCGHRYGQEYNSQLGWTPHRLKKTWAVLLDSMIFLTMVNTSSLLLGEREDRFHGKLRSLMPSNRTNVASLAVFNFNMLVCWSVRSRSSSSSTTHRPWG